MVTVVLLLLVFGQFFSTNYATVFHVPLNRSNTNYADLLHFPTDNNGSITNYTDRMHFPEKINESSTSLTDLYDLTVNKTRYQLSDFMFKVNVSSNASGIVNRIDLIDGVITEEVDCFGLGKTVAKALEWFFMDKPNGTNALNVMFYLSSRNQPRRVEVLLGEQFGLEWTDFRIERRTVIIVHGFLSHSHESWISDLEKVFLEWDDVNIIVVDWCAGGNTWNYYKAAVNTRVVGYQIASFLEQIANVTLEDPSNYGRTWGPLHLVGHSLGAHICGFVAKELKKKNSNWVVQRITGLDPAQPCFKNADASVKLHKSDAQFVDIVHTNGRMLLKFGLGLPEPLGHIDFYPNGGKTQPGCVKSSSSIFSYLPIPQQMINKAICSHGRSYIYLTESLINAVTGNCTFWARHWNFTYQDVLRIIREPCDEHACTEMGINAEYYPHRGTYFVATANNGPFCINSTRITNEVRNQLQAEYGDHLKD